ncbi:rod shape-determining protein RodA [Clostridium gelidum]|uniref:Rod shape-determining protein RodA n=1 Tax=Clostridium gelidum TaxID=704125 RepID=A0ABM7SYL7_9CLOT|nr:FtsW/RodA/SpoVE family cell cycle protein [Clostridium gelidum]BCZ44701.1 rod shape-determining protein RodA [Clostridium gelidum]
MFKRFKLDVRLIKEIDKTLLISLILLILYGILNVYLCTKAQYGLFFVKSQVIWFALSMLALYIFMAVDYTTIFNYVPIFYWGSVILLLLAMVPGIGVVVNGARGWIRVGGFGFQPAEIAKLGIILMIAKRLDEMEGKINEVKNFFILVFYAAVPVLIIVRQPDMGMSMVCFFIVLGIFYTMGLDIRIIGGGLMSLVLAIIIVWNSGFIQLYQKERFTGFLNPEVDSANTYQLKQSLIGIGSGGILGSRPSFSIDGSSSYSAQNVPEPQTDFIFAAIADQYGFLGAIVLLTLYGFLIYKMISIARTSKDIFGSVICVGIVSYFLFAIFQNIGMTIGLMPITGITLPLISCGGSSLLTTVISVGLVINVGMRRKKIFF